MPELAEMPRLRKIKWTVARSENRNLGVYQIIRRGREVVARMGAHEDAHAEMVRMRDEWLKQQIGETKTKPRRRKA